MSLRRLMLLANGLTNSERQHVLVSDESNPCFLPIKADESVDGNGGFAASWASGDKRCFEIVIIYNADHFQSAVFWAPHLFKGRKMKNVWHIRYLFQTLQNI